MRKIVLGFLLVLARGIAAQESGEPRGVASLGIGAQQDYSFADGGTQSTWRFGSGVSYGVAFEGPIHLPALLAGIRVSSANIPLEQDFFQTGDVGVVARGTATVTQFFATLRATGGDRVHVSLEGGAGFTRYSNFRFDNGTFRGSTNTDPAFSIGLSAGFNITKQFAIDGEQLLVQDIHERTGLSANQPSSAGVVSTRVVFRFYAPGREEP
jgi:hypothetical protein